MYRIRPRPDTVVPEIGALCRSLQRSVSSPMRRPRDINNSGSSSRSVEFQKEYKLQEVHGDRRWDKPELVHSRGAVVADEAVAVAAADVRGG